MGSGSITARGRFAERTKSPAIHNELQLKMRFNGKQLIGINSLALEPAQKSMKIKFTLREPT